MTTHERLKLLAIGDVHLGTRPASVAVTLNEYGVELEKLTPEAALAGAVQRAIEEKVHAVLFAGDVVESTNARFEALRPLEEAVKRLAAAGIPVLAVVGNHDVEALPRLAHRIEGLELIGEGGRWESRVVHAGGRPAIELVGWSFGTPQVRSSPVAELLRVPLSRAHPGLPRLGILHGDRDVASSPYAPFSSAELRSAGLDGWLLGHIHRPSLGDSPPGSPPIGYLGSLVGLDPTETGAHGPWLIELDDTGRICPRQLVIAPLRWQHADIEVGIDEDVETLADRLLDELARIARQVLDSGHRPRALGVRLQLTGPTNHFDAIQRRIEHGDFSQHVRDVEGTVVFLNKVKAALVVAVDLQELAGGDDPAALLARKLLALAQDGEQRAELLAQARKRIEVFTGQTDFAPLKDAREPDDPLSDAQLQLTLHEAGMAALHSLLNQRRSHGQPQGDAS